MMKIFYDGECPFCTNYVKYIRLKEASGQLDLVNIREDAQAFKLLTAKNFDLDEGMVAEVDGQYYHGEDALHIMALMSSKSSLFNKMNAAVFSSHKLSKFLYPILRAGRNLTLFFLGKERLQPKDEDLDRYHIFAFMFGFFAIYHFVIYTTQYHSIQITSFTNLILGIALALNPKSKRLFVLLVMSLLGDGILHAPIGSNHTIIKNFLILGIILTGVWRLWVVRNTNWQKFFEGFVPIGRSLLLIMYFFGIFHKINSDFLNPVSSCAVTLMHEMPVVSLFAEQSWAQYIGIWSTFVIEGGVMIALIVPRWRYFGIVVGVAFHIMLATSGYAFYPTFSTLSIMLHSLFLPANTLSRFKATRLGEIAIGAGARVRNQYILVVFIAVQMLAAIYLPKYVATIPWFFWALPFLLFIIQCGKEDKRQFSPVFPRTIMGAIVVMLFFINGFSPYLGIKSAQSINMFANLQLENNRSNHLIMPPPFMFDYMQDVVTIKQTSPDSLVEFYHKLDYQLVYYGLLNFLDADRDIVVTFERDGIVYENQSYATLKHDIDAILHPRFVRKWLHFSSVNNVQPKPCSLYN